MPSPKAIADWPCPGYGYPRGQSGSTFFLPWESLSKSNFSLRGCVKPRSCCLSVVASASEEKYGFLSTVSKSLIEFVMRFSRSNHSKCQWSIRNVENNLPAHVPYFISTREPCFGWKLLSLLAPQCGNQGMLLWPEQNGIVLWWRQHQQKCGQQCSEHYYRRIK